MLATTCSVHNKIDNGNQKGRSKVDNPDDRPIVQAWLHVKGYYRAAYY